MTTQEFSNQFDVKLQSAFNQIDRNTSITLTMFDEYEKSVFLTEAQDDVVKGIYNSTLGLGFENKEEAREYLKSLIRTQEFPMNSDTIMLPEDVLFIIHEVVKLSGPNICDPNSWKDVEVVKYNDLNRILKNPFRGPTNNRALRLDIDAHTIQIISNNTVTDYKVTYLVAPSPIILTDLTSDDLSIDGVSTVTECMLNPAIHDLILDIAVKKALQSRVLTNK